MSKALTVTFPLPSKAHDKNNRVHWKARMRTWQDGRDVAILLVREQLTGLSTDDPVFTSPVRVNIRWQFSMGRQPDFDNALARCSHFFDAFTHTGIWEDDMLMQAVEFDFERVPRGEEQVVLTLRPIKKYATV